MIQTLANSTGLTQIHNIERFTEISEHPLSEEKWKSIFMPIIEKYNYQKNGDLDIWTKEYLPK